MLAESTRGVWFVPVALITMRLYYHASEIRSDS
jgi:hypothetical protein